MPELRERLASAMRAPAPLRDALGIGALGALCRLGVVLWAAGRFPPVEDARFYHQLATRLARGNGYTWQWPDGVVTFVAHYPVGYPALLSPLYALFGPHAVLGMLLNAALGSLAVVAVHRIAAASVGRVGAGLAAFAAALHPALVFYTPALMTEGVTAALLACAGWVAVVAARADKPLRFWLLLGAVFGVAALVRGQSLLAAPLFGLVAGLGRDRRPWLGALVVTLAAAALVLPWTLRNCKRMDRCVVVSANVGWNLLIGATEGATGTFVPIAGPSVPAPCRSVFGEADKDACFAREAALLVRERPLRWLGLVPKKLEHTFEYCGAAGWYLESSHRESFPESAKLALGVIETTFQRALLLFGLWGAARVPGPRRSPRQVLAALGTALVLMPFAWLASVLLVVSALLLGRRLASEPVLALGVAALGATMLTHAVFFGAGRYSLVVFPLAAAAAGLALAQRDPSRFDIPRAAG